MENRSHAIIAVSFLIVFSVGAVLVYYWLAHRQNEPLAYEIVTSESVGGLSVQAEVKFKGIVVGHVTRIAFDPADRSRVIVDLQLQPKTYVTHATYAEVAMQGLTGGSALELKLGKGSRAPLATSGKHPARIPMHPSLLGSLMASAGKNMHDLENILASTNKMLDKANRQHVSASLAQIDTATRKLAAIEAQLTPLLTGTQKSIDQSHALLANSNKLVQEAQAPVRNATSLEASIEALSRSTRQLSERVGRQTLPDVNTLSQSLLRTSHQLDELLRELKGRPQSLLFGPPRQPPGPGEPGFQAGGKRGDP